MMSSEYAPTDHAELRLRQEACTAMAIYQTRFPDSRIRLVLYEGENPLWAAPIVRHGHIAFEPSHLAGTYVGCIEGGATGHDAPLVNVFLSIPRAPNPAERSTTEPDWHPRGRALHLLYRLSPMLYERIRHAAERWQERRAGRHHWAQLGRGQGARSFAPAAPPAGAAPAILIGVHWLDVGGAEKLALDCIQWARDAGLRVIVVAAVPGLHPLQSKLPEGVRFIRADRYLAHHEWPLFLEKLIRDENIRLIHIHHCVPLYDALGHLRIATPWVKVIDSTHIVEYADGGYPRISGVWTNFIDTHHVISRHLGDFYRNRFAVGQKAVLGRMLGAAGTPAPANMQAGKPQLEITFIGRLYYQKRPITVILAMQAIAAWAEKSGAKVRFNMVGEGPFARACDHLARRVGLGDRLVAHPAGSDVPAILSRSDILLLPSSNEGLALVCYEAVEHGAIPISTDVGAQSEIVPPGLLVPRDPARAAAQTAQIVARLWAEPAFLTDQVNGLHDRYRALSSDPRAKDVIGDIYRKVLEDRE